MAKHCFPLVCVFVLAALLYADGPGDNLPDKVRPVPPPGIPLKNDDPNSAMLRADVEALGGTIEQLRQGLKGKPALLELLPDVQIFHNAVRYALKYNEFYNPKELAIAHKLVAQGMGKERCQELF